MPPMAPAPFLYQTRTLRRLLASPSLAMGPARQTRSATTTAARRGRALDNAIPFEWDRDMQDDEPESTTGTITPAEAKIFEGIFDEIAQGRMPAPRKRAAGSGRPAKRGPAGGMARSIVEQARVTEFRDKFLGRYPPSLRKAAQMALGLYALDTPGPSASRMLELDEADRAKWAQRARYDAIRAAERERIGALMAGCDTDAALWRVMVADVFSLPRKLGIAAAGVGGRKAAAQGDERLIMDVHGPLYPHLLNTGLDLLDTAFARPSAYAFAILPRVKALGLASYVLGVSTPFYARLARIHWERFGDAAGALDVLHEMAATGLHADGAVAELVARIRDHVHGCSWGAQGPFVMAMMETPPFDGSLARRLDDLERYASESNSGDEHHEAA